MHETMLEGINKRTLRSIWADDNINYVLSSSIGNSGGLICIWKTNIELVSLVPPSLTILIVLSSIYTILARLRPIEGKINHFDQISNSCFLSAKEL